MRLAGAARYLLLPVLGLILQGGGAEHSELRPCTPFAPSGRKLSTDVVDVLPPGEWTDKLHTLLDQTKKLAKVPIRFTLQTGGAFGYVARTDEGYVIGIRPDLDHEDQESDIAHELYHINLQAQGFSAQIHSPSEAPPLLMDLGYTITSCVDDAIVDERTLVLGFNPERLNRKRFEQFQPPTDVLVRLKDPVYADGTALVIACDSFRVGNGNALLERWALISKVVADRAEQLRKRIGDVKCDGAQSCNEKKKRIRDIFGYPILLCNPLVGRWE